MRLPLQCETRPGVFLDVYVQSVKVGSKVRCKPLDGQPVSPTLWVECSRKQRNHYPVGTIFKVDLHLVRPQKRKPYLATFRRNALETAIEYAEYNQTLQ